MPARRATQARPHGDTEFDGPARASMCAGPAPSHFLSDQMYDPVPAGAFCCKGERVMARRLLPAAGIGAVALAAGLVAALAADKGGRDDLSAEDAARVAAVTRPTNDFSKPERFEARSAGAGTYMKRVTRMAFSHPLANLSVKTRRSSASATGSLKSSGSPRPPRPAPRTGSVRSSTPVPARAAMCATAAAARPRRRVTALSPCS